jgi:hypothetical protein
MEAARSRVFATQKFTRFVFAPEYENREVLLSQLGKHKSSKACVYVKKLSEMD